MTPNPVYNLTISPDTGGTITVNRTYSASGGKTGVLSAGTKILCYGDILKITFTPKTNYTIVTRTVNGTSFTSGNTHTVSSNVSAALTSKPTIASVNVSSPAYVEKQATITLSPYNSAYNYKIEYSMGAYSEQIDTNIISSKFSWTIPKTLYSYIPDKASIFYFRCKTYNGSTLIGTTETPVTISVSEELCKPEISVSLTDISNIPTLTGDNTAVVSGLSAVQLDLTITAKNGATITSAYINGRAISLSQTNSGIYTGRTVFTECSYSGFSCTTLDSRKIQSTSTAYASRFIPYTPLTCNPVISRKSSGGNTVLLSIDKSNYYNGSFGAYDNTLSLSYRYRKYSDTVFSDWTEIDPLSYKIASSTYYTNSPIEITDEIDYREQYVFQIEAKDGANGVVLKRVVKTVDVFPGIPVFDWGKDDFNFNVPVKFNGEAMGDFVVETQNYYGFALVVDGQPYTPNWTVQRWNSGYMKCWTKITITTSLSEYYPVNTSASISHSAKTIGSLGFPYYLNDSGGIAGSWFIETPSINVTVQPGSTACWVVPGSVIASTSGTGSFILVGNKSSSGTIILYYEATGRWK
jgi:hypothetical protein